MATRGQRLPHGARGAQRSVSARATSIFEHLRAGDLGHRRAVTDIGDARRIIPTHLVARSADARGDGLRVAGLEGRSGGPRETNEKMKFS